MEPRDSSLFELPEQTLRGPRRGATATVLRAETEKASQSVQSTDRIDMSLYTVPHCHTPFQSVVGRLAFSWDGFPKLHHHHISQTLHNSSFLLRRQKKTRSFCLGKALFVIVQLEKMPPKFDSNCKIPCPCSLVSQHLLE